jgi:DNA repair protein RecO (recombination protein O)
VTVGRAKASLESAAILLRSIPYGESDRVVQLLTENYGRISAMVRGGARSRKRAPGAFEPFHTVRVRMSDHGGELARVDEAELVVVRGRLVTSLEAMDAAGKVLRWVRVVCVPRTPEPRAWALTTHVLDTLEGDPSVDEAVLRARLVWAGLGLLEIAGVGLVLEGCAVCGAECPPNRSALVDVARGGVVCRACGGGPLRIDAATRTAAVLLAAHPDLARVEPPPGRILTDLERLLASAMGRHELEARPRA